MDIHRCSERASIDGYGSTSGKAFKGYTSISGRPSKDIHRHPEGPSIEGPS
jgi:hypothetical protein